MNYSQIAVKAAELAVSSQKSPDITWKTVLNREGMKDKSCPKGVFLGLCQNGLVKGIGAGSYTNATKNIQYGLIARELLLDNPSRFENSSKELWLNVLDVLNIGTITSNQQAEVVIALWKSGLLL